MILDLLLDAIDPNDPVHTEARDRLARCKELRERGAMLTQEGLRLLDAEDLEGAQKIIAESQAVNRELKALVDRAAHVTASLRDGTETMQ